MEDLDPSTSTNTMETPMLPPNPNDSTDNLLNWEVPDQKESGFEDMDMKDDDQQREPEKVEKAGKVVGSQEGITVEAEKSAKVRMAWEKQCCAEEDENARKDALANLMKYARGSLTHLEGILKPLDTRIEKKNEIIELKNSEIIEMNRIKSILENEILDLQANGIRLRAPLQTDDPKMKKFGDEKINLVSWLESMEIHSIKDMEEIFQQTESIKKQKATRDELIKTYETERNDFQAQLSKQRQQWNEDKLKLRMLEERVKKYENEERWKMGNAQSNSYSRLGNNKGSTDENNDKNGFQTRADASPSGPSTRRRMQMENKSHTQGEYGDSEELGARRERPRMMVEDVNLSYGAHENESDREYEDEVKQGYYQSAWGHGGQIQNQGDQGEGWKMMLAQQTLPEPAVFSAEGKNVNLSAFEKSFTLKFGMYPEEHKVILLETKYLTGKAAKIFRGLQEFEKTTVKKVFQALANRLRVSPADEAMRARNRWDKVAKTTEQTFEDYCLVLDEQCKKAFGSCSREVSSGFKVAKLMNALSDDYMLHFMVEQKLDEIVGDQNKYEAARQMLMRYEFGQAQKKEEAKTAAGEKKKPVQQPPLVPMKAPIEQKVNNNSSQSNTHQFNRNNQQRARTAPPTQQHMNEQGQNRTTVGFHICDECKEVGCHNPECSKAPRATRGFVPQNDTCFRCHEKGHFAHNCPKGFGPKNTESKNNSDTVSSIVEKQVLAIPNSEKEKEEGFKTAVKYTDGRIGKTKVVLMIDSGACISLMPRKIWDEIVKENGQEWEKTVKIEPPRLTKVFAGVRSRLVTTR